MASASRTSLQHRVWRWHFIAGLMVVPFAIILAVTGAIYLFKPQFDAAVEARINAGAAPLAGETLPADVLVSAALEAYPGSALVRLILPSADNDPTVEVETRGAGGPRTLWIDRSTGEILHQTATGSRFMNTVKDIHGTLLAGKRGSLVVEIMASWMIILIVTGLYLWWPRGTVWWRVFLPDFRANGGPRETWRRVHGMTGAWIGGLVLAILLSGLPWTEVWGDGYSRVKRLAGLEEPGQEWFVTLQSSDPHADHSLHAMHHDHSGMLWDQGGEEAVTGIVPADDALALEDILKIARPQQYPPPVWVQPPRGENGVWTIRSMGPSRTDRVTVHYDRFTGEEILRITFAHHNPVDRFVAQGVAFHEGQLLGPLNQLTGVLAALGVILMSVSGAVMWWRRRPKGRLGLPPMPADRRLTAGMVVLVIAFGIFLPMAGITLVAALGGDLLYTQARRMIRARQA
ncbi:MAG: PepSY-associated TM helix domain-containing protein [Hyphomonas sp.]